MTVYRPRKLVITKTSLRAPKQDTQYWRSQPYAARLAALEELRHDYHLWKYGAEPRFQRVYSVTQR
jgi:hypothetical protein